MTATTIQTFIKLILTLWKFFKLIYFELKLWYMRTY